MTTLYTEKLMIAMEDSEDDRREIAQILAFFMTGMQDDFSRQRLIRTLMARANEIVERVRGTA